MNLQPQLAWAENVLGVLGDPAKVESFTTPERMQEKLGWLREYADAVPEWSEWQRVVDIAVGHVGCQGIGKRSIVGTYRAMPSSFVHASSEILMKDLVRFVAVQARQAKGPERFPGSTEVLESCFGKMKELEKQQSRGGFANLAVSFG